MEREMTKVQQKIILFINQSESFERSTSICNLYMNRFAIEEEAGSEILKIFQFEMDDPYVPYGRGHVPKGTGLIIIE